MAAISVTHHACIISIVVGCVWTPAVPRASNHVAARTACPTRRARGIARVAGAITGVVASVVAGVIASVVAGLRAGATNGANKRPPYAVTTVGAVVWIAVIGIAVIGIAVIGIAVIRRIMRVLGPDIHRLCSGVLRATRIAITTGPSRATTVAAALRLRFSTTRNRTSGTRSAVASP